MFISVTPLPPGVPDLSRPVPGNYAFLTYLHEICHAMGLGHAGDYASSNPSWAVDALFAEDTEQHTVMSYFQSQDYANGNDHYDPRGGVNLPRRCC